MVGENKRQQNNPSRATILILAFSLSTGLSPFLTPAKSVWAADFKHAKKIIVPATRIPRRYDYDSMGGRVASPQVDNSYQSSGDYSSYNDSSSSSSSGSSKGKYSLVPPPPPVAPSLLPSSMTHEVPPPPSYATSRSALSGMSRHSAAYHNPTSSQPQSLTSHHIVSKAEQLANSGHLKDAQELLIKQNKLAPADKAVRQELEKVSNERAKYYLRKDNYLEAANQARIALKAAPKSSSATSLLDQSLRHQRIDPLNSESRLVEARKLFTQGRYDQAEVEYLQSIKLKPSADAQIGLGNIALQAGKLKTAKSQYQKALDLAPQSSVALRQLGITRYKLTDVVGANADLTRALVQDPDDKLASQNLIDLWQRQVASHPNQANSHLGLARAYQLSGDLKSAQNEYRTVVKIDPDHPNLPAARESFKLALARQEAYKAYQAGKTLETHNAFREAFDRASEAVRLSPGDTRYQLFQAQMLEKLGDLPGAKSAYLQILSSNPTNTIAAQRVAALNSMALPADAAPQAPVAYNNQTNLSVPQYRGEGPALSYLPGPNGATYQKIPTADPVQNMTGFLGSLRDLMLSQKKMLKQDENTVMESLGLGSKASSTKSSSVAGMPDLPDIDSSVPSIDANSLIKSEDIKNLISRATGKAPSSSPSPSSAATTDNTSTAAPQSWSALAINAGQSMINNRLNPSSSSNPTDQQSVIRSNPFLQPNIYQPMIDPATGSAIALKASSLPPIQPQNTAPAMAPPISYASPTQQTNATYPPYAPPIRTISQNNSKGPIQAAPPIIGSSQGSDQTRNLDDLQSQNQILKEKLSQAHRQLEELKSNQDEVVSEDVQGELEKPGLENGANSPDSDIEAANTESPELRGAINEPVKVPATNNIHLELLGVKAAKKDIHLKVRLRNDQNSFLLIPSQQKAVIRIAGSEDKLVPMKFPRKKLAAHSTMEGYIKVPGQKLSPAADVFIPELQGPSSNQSNQTANGVNGSNLDNSKTSVHLTVPISSLPGGPH